MPSGGSAAASTAGMPLALTSRSSMPDGISRNASATSPPPAIAPASGSGSVRR